MHGKNTRVAFRMKVDPGQVDEYITRHNPIWPELETALLEHGVETYSIYLDRITNDLFAYAEVSDLEKWQAMADTAIVKKWWVSMAPLMSSNADNSPVVGELEEVFHMEAEA